MAANTSGYAIFFYYILTLFPHVYAAYILNSAGVKPDNTNPRSADVASSIKRKLPLKIFAKYERAEAAHKNGMENMALFMGAVILGNLAHLGAAELNGIAWAYIGTRVLYTAAYIGFSTARLSYIRSGIWAVGTVLCLYLIARSGTRLGDAWVVYQIHWRHHPQSTIPPGDCMDYQWTSQSMGSSYGHCSRK